MNLNDPYANFVYRTMASLCEEATDDLMVHATLDCAIACQAINDFAIEWMFCAHERASRPA